LFDDPSQHCPNKDQQEVRDGWATVTFVRPSDCRMPHVATTERVLSDLDTQDSDRLKELVLEQHFQLVSHNSEIESLKLLILKLRRMQFGPGTERLARHIDQLGLRLEDPVPSFWPRL